MKITSIETFSKPGVALLRLTCESGATGWGQIATTEAADIVATCLHRQVARVVIGREIDDHGTILDDVLHKNLKFPGSYICRALAAVDTALIDLRAKIAEQTAWQFLGSTPDPVAVYGSSMSRDITPRDEAARMGRLRDESGYRAFKLRVGSWSGNDVDSWPGRTEELIPTVRKALGDDVTIHADANSCYSPARALEVGRMLEDNDYGHFEEPCPYWEYDWTKRVTAKLRIPVAGGEQDNYMPAWRYMITDHVVDIVQPDICYVGGVTRTLKIARFAAEHGLLCTPHSANHSLVTVFTLALRNALPNPGPFMEFSIEDQTNFRAMFTPALTVSDGVVKLPDEGYGWGVTIKPDWLERAEYRITTADS